MCEFDDCELPPKARGLCNRHYQQWQRSVYAERPRAGHRFPLLRTSDCLREALDDIGWPPIDAGFCCCGCGQPTNIAQQTNRCWGQVKGEPLHFRLGHAGGIARYYRGPRDPETAAREIERLFTTEPMGDLLWLCADLNWTGRTRNLHALIGAALIKSASGLDWPMVAKVIADHSCLQAAIGGSPSQWACYRFDRTLREIEAAQRELAAEDQGLAGAGGGRVGGPSDAVGIVGDCGGRSGADRF